MGGWAGGWLNNAHHERCLAVVVFNKVVAAAEFAEARQADAECGDDVRYDDTPSLHTQTMSKMSGTRQTAFRTQHRATLYSVAQP